LKKFETILSLKEKNVIFKEKRGYKKFAKNIWKKNI